MQISGLSASNTFSATDVLAIEVNVNGVEKTYKLTGATLAAALASIGSYLKTTDVTNLYSIERHQLVNAVSVNANTNFEIVISIGKTGYTAVSISGWNLNDRDSAPSVHISGMTFNNNKTQVLLYGATTGVVEFKANAYVDVLYIKNY